MKGESKVSGSRGTEELKIKRELTWRYGNQPKKAEVVKLYSRRHILKTIGKRKTRRSFTISVRTLNETEEKVAFKGTVDSYSIHGSAR
jgi:hypothetical protein